MVKVKMASLGEAKEEGTAILRLTTTDGLEDIEFLLDDVSVAFLAVTAGFVVKDIKARTEGDPTLIRSFASDKG